MKDGRLVAAECSLEIGGQWIRYSRAGTGPPLLLIHGLLGGSFCWRFNVPVLAKQYTVHAVDLPGLAYSDETGIDCSMSRQGERLRLLIEVIGGQDWTLVGSSFGGATAMLMAAEAVLSSVRIGSLVLCAPVNPWSHFGRERIRILSTGLGGYFLRATLPLSRPCHGIAVRRMFGNPSRMPKDAVEGYRKSILRRGRALNVLTALRNWEKDVDSLREAISKIEAPTLLVWGDRDPAVDPRSALDLKQRLRNADVKFLPGVGHLAFEESPEEFNRIVLEFLNTQDKQNLVGNG